MNKPYDVAIIGGGINGCGCAADAALRGLSVILFEKNDLASQTSSSSSKLIHGGLRYLEQFDFSLVRKALNERQTLLDLAPHLVHPLQFMLPQSKPSRASWLIRIGLFIYDHLSTKNRLPKSLAVSRQQTPLLFKPLLPKIKQGFTYYDCSTDDARLTIANALQANIHGATICANTEVIQANIINSLWHLTVKTHDQTVRTITAKTVINAAGPWVTQVNQLLNIPNHHAISLVKGSHIVLPQLYEGEHAYILQHPDQRIVFTIPYHGYTLVGTTDVAHHNIAERPDITTSEIDYLLHLISQYFNHTPQASDIIATWSGLRPLLSEPSKKVQTLTRDYSYHYTSTPAPCVSIYGGKITTYRLVAQKAVDQLRSIFPQMPTSTTKRIPLPGARHFHMFSKQAAIIYPWLPKSILDHYLQTYGDRAQIILKDCQCMNDLGLRFSGILYQREVDYLIKEEWAKTTDDILLRRTKLGLNMNPESIRLLKTYVSTSDSR